MQFLLSWAVFLTLCLTLGLHAKDQNQTDSRRKALYSILGGVTHSGEPGCSVLVNHPGQPPFETGLGLTELGGHVPITARTNFRLASFSKQFTAMAVMLLIHDGKLRYDSKLTDIFPEFPSYGKEITMRHLLTHTSGLQDYEMLMDQEERMSGRHWSDAHQIQDSEVLVLLEKTTKGIFPPGTDWAYSNSGYVVLGLVIAKVSGNPYGNFLRERIFAPLHMDSTIVYLKGKNEVAHRAFGHVIENGKILKMDQSSTSATLGDGGIYSNVEDLLKWDNALTNNTLLSKEEMQIAWTPARLSNGAPTLWPKEPGGDNLDPGHPVSYGYGWFLDPYEGHVRTWHGGSTMGFRTVIERFPDDHLTIVILCNRADATPEKLALEISDLYLK